MAKVGRPLKYEDPEQMYEKAMEYFNLKKGEGKPYTVVGLALHLGFADKQSLIDYANREEFSFTIKAIKSRIEEYLEERLDEGNCTGTIFNLKNNFGWKDKQDIDHSSSDGTMSPKASIDPSKLTTEQLKALKAAQIEPNE